jgi:predicted small integral membrane protein
MAVMIAAAMSLAFVAPVAAADPERPFGATFTTVDSFDLTHPGCPGDAFLRATVAGRGQLLHLGLTQVAFTHCTWLDLVTGAGWTGIGDMTLTAANGDKLFLHYQATFQMDPWPDFVSSTVGTFPWTVVGGTGRFVHASGSGTGHGFGVMAEGSSTYWLSGTISY